MPVLSHYTPRLGLEGIASSGTFWATNFLDLNDKSEFFYAWLVLQKDAMHATLEKLPKDLLRPDIDIDQSAITATENLRSFLRNEDGYGQLYVTSFARGKTEDHDERGILTLWDRYTQYEGYCLQYDVHDVIRMLEMDLWRASYGAAGMHEVRYSVDRDSWEYKQLLFQYSQMLLREIAREQRDARVPVEHEEMWADSAVLRKALEFCATHKDPCFEDEREVRLFFYPSPQAEARVFTGIASSKHIRRRADGKRYIAIGEHWTPGISPRRIIVGPKADANMEGIIGMFSKRPTIARANIPVA